MADVRLQSNRAQATLFVDDHPVGVTPLEAPVRISAGRREIRAELPGYPPVIRKVDVVGNEALVVELDFGTPIAAQSEAPRADSSPGAALWTGIATGVFGLGTAGMALWTNSDQRTYDEAFDRRNDSQGARLALQARGRQGARHGHPARCDARNWNDHA